MEKSHHSWKSYVFLIASLMVPILMFLLDPIAIATDEKLTGVIILLILAGIILSIIMGIISFISKHERKEIPYIATMITFFNIEVIIFFIVLGANFA